jgi:hypothetical protein
VDRDGPAGLQHPTDLGEHPPVVLDVLDDVEREDEIDRGVGDRQNRGVRNRRGPNVASASETHRIEAPVRRANPSEAREIGGHRAGPRPDVEHAQPRPRQPLGQQSPKQHPLAGKPPVVHLDGVHLLEIAEVHERSELDPELLDRHAEPPRDHVTIAAL